MEALNLSFIDLKEGSNLLKVTYKDIEITITPMQIKSIVRMQYVLFTCKLQSRELCKILLSKNDPPFSFNLFTKVACWLSRKILLARWHRFRRQDVTQLFEMLSDLLSLLFCSKWSIHLQEYIAYSGMAIMHNQMS